MGCCFGRGAGNRISDLIFEAQEAAGHPDLAPVVYITRHLYSPRARQKTWYLMWFFFELWREQVAGTEYLLTWVLWQIPQPVPALLNIPVQQYYLLQLLREYGY